MHAHGNRFFCSAAVAFCVAVLSSLLAGCVEPPKYPTEHRTYRVPAAGRPVSSRPVSTVPKTVSPEKSPASTGIAPAKSVSSAGVGQSGQLADIVSRIRSRDADRARSEEIRRREERDRWLENHETEFASVRSRLKSMGIFAVTASDERLKARVRDAIAATEKEIDALRARAGSGPVGYSEAAEIRTSLRHRHEALAASSEEYRRIVK